MSTGKELLLKSNIFTGCRARPKNELIKEIGGVLVKSGYVNDNYVDAMFERELSFSTYLGNGIAMPHGIDSAKKEIRESGLTVMIFPEGTDWDGNKVHIVIGLAGRENEHLKILGNLANTLIDERSVRKMIDMDVDEIYKVITNKE